jgi:hypothetical protein
MTKAVTDVHDKSLPCPVCGKMQNYEPCWRLYDHRQRQPGQGGEVAIPYEVADTL